MADRIRLRDRLSAFLNPRVVVPPGAALPGEGKRHVESTYSFMPIQGGRQTQPVNYNPFGLQGWYFIPKRQYALIDTTKLDISQFSAQQLLALLPDLNPDFSKAVWNFLRIAGTEIEMSALTSDGVEDPDGQLMLDDLRAGINDQFGGEKALITQLLQSAYLQGAACVDVAPTEDLKDIEDVYSVNPDTIWFERDKEQHLVPFQRQAIWRAPGALPYRMMNEETFYYVPIDPFIDDPYGRPPAAPALQAVLNMQQVLSDLGKVVHHQGWPRLDFKLVWELMEPLVPVEIKQDEQKLNTWLSARIQDVTAAYNAVKPEDAYIHYDFVEVNSDKAAAGQKLFDVAAVVHVFRQELIQGLKSLPIFHGEHVGSTETYGTVEYQIYVQSVQAIREVVSSCLVRAYTVGLHLRGRDCQIQSEWKQIEAGDRMKDATAEAAEIENEVNKRDQGWINQDDASTRITGSAAVAPPPVAAPAPMGVPVPPPQPMPPGADGSAPGGNDSVGSGLDLSGLGFDPTDPAKGLATRINSGMGFAQAYTKAALDLEIRRLMGSRKK